MDDSYRDCLPIAVAHPIRLARLARGWSLRRAAAEIGISVGHLSYIERGLRCPSNAVARDLISVLLPQRRAEAEELLWHARPASGRSFVL